MGVFLITNMSITEKAFKVALNVTETVYVNEVTTAINFLRHEFVNIFSTMTTMPAWNI